LLYGVVGAVATVGSGSGSRSTPGDATHAATIGALVLWLLGVWLLVLAPAARRFPRAGARVAAAVAVANAAVGHCLAPWNLN